MRRRDRRARTTRGDLLAVVLEMGDVLWLVLTFVVRLPVLLLRLLT